MKIIANIKDKIIEDFEKIGNDRECIITPFLNYYFSPNYINWTDMSQYGGEWKQTKERLKKLPKSKLREIYSRFLELKQKGYWDKIH